MNRLTNAAFVCLAMLLAGAVAGFSAGVRAGITMEYGTASNTFGLSSPGIFFIPPQVNGSNDFVLSGDIEYLAIHRRPLDIGIELKGSFAFSNWDLGFPSFSDEAGDPFLYPGDGIHVGAEWWALAAMATAHLHLVPGLTLDGAIGYGPYGYTNVNYWDDYGIVSGTVVQTDTVFPSHAWSVDWSAGLSFGIYLLSLSLDVGMMGPDFVTGLGIEFLL